MQQTDGLMHCIENFAYLHHLHGTIRSLYVSVYFRALGDVQQARGGGRAGSLYATPPSPPPPPGFER